MCYWVAGDKRLAELWFRHALQKGSANQEALAKPVELYFEQKAFAKVAGLYAHVPLNEHSEEQTILKLIEGSVWPGACPCASRKYRSAQERSASCPEGVQRVSAVRS
jgi:hypothetical protein